MMSSHVEHNSVGTQTSGDNEAFNWRFAQYIEMGFNEAQAEALANSTTTSYTGGKNKNSKRLAWNVPLDWKKVKDALDQGCDKELALTIFLSE